MRSSPQGIVAAFAGATAIATAPIFAVLAHELTALPPLVTAMWRTTLAVPVLLFLNDVVRRNAPQSEIQPRRASVVFWLLLPGLFFAADLAAWHTAMTTISAGNATFLANLAAVIVPVVAWFSLSERPGRRFIVGAAIAISGSALLLLRPNESVLRTLPGAGDGFTSGNVLAVVTAFCYAGYQLASRRARRFASTVRVMLWTALGCSALLGLVAWATGAELWPRQPVGWLPLLGMTLCGQLVGQGLIVWSMRHTSASVLAVALLWQPVASTVLGYLVLGQLIAPLQALGMLVAVAGLVLVSVPHERRPRVELSVET